MHFFENFCMVKYPSLMILHALHCNMNMTKNVSDYKKTSALFQPKPAAAKPAEPSPAPPVATPAPAPAATEAPKPAEEKKEEKMETTQR